MSAPIYKLRQHSVHGLGRRVLIGGGLEREGGGGLVALLEGLGATAQVLGEEALGAPVEVYTVGLRVYAWPRDGSLPPDPTLTSPPGKGLNCTRALSA